MPELITELMQKLAEIPLPFTLKFNSKSLRLSDIMSADEARYRNRPYSLLRLAGKTGTLTLGAAEITTVSISEKGGEPRITVEDRDALKRLGEALEYCEIDITASAGRAALPVSAAADLKYGKIIVLDAAPDSPSAAVFPEIDYVFCTGETMDVDGSFGIRVTSTDGYYRQTTAAVPGICGEVVLGRTTIPVSDLTAVGEGTIIKFAGPSAPHFFRLSDGTVIRGFLQCFTREELIKHQSVLNPIPDNGSDLLLAFRITSGHADSASLPTADTEESSSGKVTASGILSALSPDRAVSILAAMPVPAAVRILKTAEPALAAGIIMPLCTAAAEEDRGYILKCFADCRPALSPLKTAEAILSEALSYMDGHERRAAVSASKELYPDPPVSDPAERAAETFNRLGNYEIKLLLQWLEIEDRTSLAAVRPYIFLFEDIAELSDRNIQKILREIETADLCTALSGRGCEAPQVAEAVKRNMSGRAQVIFNEELSYCREVSAEKCYEARDRIVSVISRISDSLL